ncbi:unnamed protein product [Adineta ricciae]|uniref:LTD domain-containing protein n=1 Tax=Adineta ricciae TaxID=249248 RepID=A0A814CW06_ADIRI|nr:unnamed protein product [Adineta ricciae]CAF1117290.1 unnamed protein product [Adineta ricciae]
MALIHRYTTDFSTHAIPHYQTNDKQTFVSQVANDISSIKKQDDDEKRYLHSLNDRLEEFLHGLDALELANKKLCDELNYLISSWGMGGENRTRFLEELDQMTRHLSEQSRQKAIFHAETKVFEEQALLTDRVTAVFLDVRRLYEDRRQFLLDYLRQLEDEYHKIQIRLELSNGQVKAHDDDYQKELAKFRSYLAEWSQIALDRQKLLIEIQSLREHYNLRLAFNQEEINEWKRLLNQITQDSTNFYRDYLETIKQQIYDDYAKMAKEQQMDIEAEMKTRLNEIQEKIKMGLLVDENDERHRREEMHRFETRLNEYTKEYDHLQSDLRTLAEENKRKRRLLQDLENEARNKTRKHAEQHAQLQKDTDLIRAEYYALKDELDKLVYTLRFSIEEELKIYEALLNSLHRQKGPRPSLNVSTNIRQTKTTDRNLYGIERDILNQNQITTTTTARTTKRSTQEHDGKQQININMTRAQQETSELNEKYMQSKIHITRKYKGNILIKFVDVGGRFVDIENTGNHPRDLTGWYIEREVDGRRLHYVFPTFELKPHGTVRIYGNYHQRSSPVPDGESYQQLIASNIRDWDTGQKMRTELFNRDDVGKALFEQIRKE